MTAKQTLQAVLDLLLDEYDEDPRKPLMQELTKLVNAPDGIPTGDLELTALVGPNGMSQVTDQHGRRVSGVKSVAVFKDQSGAPVFQVNL